MSTTGTCTTSTRRTRRRMPLTTKRLFNTRLFPTFPASPGIPFKIQAATASSLNLRASIVCNSFTFLAFIGIPLKKHPVMRSILNLRGVTHNASSLRRIVRRSRMTKARTVLLSLPPSVLPWHRPQLLWMPLLLHSRSHTKQWSHASVGGVLPASAHSLLSHPQFHELHTQTQMPTCAGRLLHGHPPPAACTRSTTFHMFSALGPLQGNA